MPEAPFAGEIEALAGGLAGPRADEALRLMSELAGLEGAAAREELDRVVCVATAPDGSLAGLGTVFPATVPLIGRVRLWVYRALLAPAAEGATEPMVAAAFSALEAGFDPGSDAPLGLCRVIKEPAEMRRTPEAVAPRSGLIHAGFLDDGSQVRLRFFAEASIGPRLVPLPPAEQRSQPPELDPRYAIVPLADGAASPDDVLALWAREGAVPAGEAERRVHEVDLVAIDGSDGLVGVSSSYLQRSARLRMDLRYFRAFVAGAHRRSSLAFLLAYRGRRYLEERFVSGADTRGQGILYEVENEALKRYRNEARWAATDFTYIGANERGAHVRVHYFPGARVPLPED